MRTWEKAPAVCLWLPSCSTSTEFIDNLGNCQSGWESPQLRSMVDEIAYRANIIVVVPDIIVHESSQRLQDDKLKALKDVIAVAEDVRKRYDAASISLGGEGSAAMSALSISNVLYELAAYECMRQNMNQKETESHSSSIENDASFVLEPSGQQSKRNIFKFLPGQLPRLGFTIQRTESLASLIRRFRTPKDFQSEHDELLTVSILGEKTSKFNSSGSIGSKTQFENTELLHDPNHTITKDIENDVNVPSSSVNDDVNDVDDHDDDVDDDDDMYFNEDTPESIKDAEKLYEMLHLKGESLLNRLATRGAAAAALHPTLYDLVSRHCESLVWLAPALCVALNPSVSDLQSQHGKELANTFTCPLYLSVINPSYNQSEQLSHHNITR